MQPESIFDMSMVLCFLIIYSLCISSVISDGIQEIPFIKKALKEHRKKMWTYYSDKFIVRCINYHKNLRLTDTILYQLFWCSDIQINEVLQRAKRKFRLVC